MKASKVITTSLFTFCLMLILGGCAKENHGPFVDNPRQGPPEFVFDPYELNCFLNAPEEINEVEELMIQFVGMEEKLAHDVYIAFSGIYPLHIFENIANSEEIHMERVKLLWDFYHEVEDELVYGEPGVFENEALQALYDELVAIGETSLLDALIVGVWIEQQDIADLTAFLGQTGNSAIVAIFENLMCGSGNHLRTFYNKLIAKGGEYVAPVEDIAGDDLTEEELNAILESTHEACKLD